jgi:micrococcal nuclease
MGRAWKPDDVATGRFGKRGRSRWLSPGDYQALSAAERKALWRERNLYRSAPVREGRFEVSVGVVLAAAVCLGIAVGLGLREEQSTPPAAAAGERVTFGLCVWGGGTNCVVDGDTIWLHGQNIRIAGIDAPETHDFKCAGEKALGDRATMRLQQLLNGGAITLSSIDRDEDVYGRKLRNVAVNGVDVGETLITEGLSREYRGAKMGWC